MLASSRSPCSVPSCPYFPWTMGNTTSTPSSEPAGPFAVISTRRFGSGARNRSGSRSSPSLDFSNASAWEELTHRPSWVIPMGTTSYFSVSSALMTDVAETSETSCSPERPPKMTPTLSFLPMALLLEDSEVAEALLHILSITLYTHSAQCTELSRSQGVFSAEHPREKDDVGGVFNLLHLEVGIPHITAGGDHTMIGEQDCIVGLHKWSQ